MDGGGLDLRAVPVALWQHAVVQDAGDEDTFGGLAVEDDVTAMLVTAQTGTNFIAGAAQEGSGRELETAGLQFGEITVGLGFTPCTDGVGADANEVCFGLTGEAKSCHVLSAGWGELERLSCACEDIPFGDAAGVALIDGRAEQG